MASVPLTAIGKTKPGGGEDNCYIYRSRACLFKRVVNKQGCKHTGINRTQYIVLLPRFSHGNNQKAAYTRLLGGGRAKMLINYHHNQAPHPGNIRQKRSGSMASCISC